MMLAPALMKFRKKTMRMRSLKMINWVSIHLKKKILTMKMSKKGNHLNVGRLGMLMNSITCQIIQEMFKVIFLYNQILKKIHNILLRNNFIHKVYNLKFQYKILIKEEGDPRLMDLFDLRIYLFLAKANNKDKIQSYSRQVVIIQCQLMLWKLRK